MREVMREVREAGIRALMRLLPLAGPGLVTPRHARGLLRLALQLLLGRTRGRRRRAALAALAWAQRR